MFLNVVSRSEVALIALISIKIRIVIDAVRVVSLITWCHSTLTCSDRNS